MYIYIYIYNTTVLGGPWRHGGLRPSAGGVPAPRVALRSAAPLHY